MSSDSSVPVVPSGTRSTACPTASRSRRRSGRPGRNAVAPPVGYFTKRTAEVWLQDLLAQARKGTLPGIRSGGATFAEAAEEWLRFIAQDRERKPSTIRDYRSALNAHLLPAFGERQLESITVEEIEAWRPTLTGLSNRTKNKLLIQLHGIFRRAQRIYGLDANPLTRIEKHPQHSSGNIEVLAPEEVWALVRTAASELELDGAVFLTAAFTGLRMGELLALRWHDVDFAGSVIRVRSSWAGGQLTTPVLRRSAAVGRTVATRSVCAARPPTRRVCRLSRRHARSRRSHPRRDLALTARPGAERAVRRTRAAGTG